MRIGLPFRVSGTLADCFEHSNPDLFQSSKQVWKIVGLTRRGPDPANPCGNLAQVRWLLQRPHHLPRRGHLCPLAHAEWVGHRGLPVSGVGVPRVAGARREPVHRHLLRGGPGAQRHLPRGRLGGGAHLPAQQVRRAAGPDGPLRLHHDRVQDPQPRHRDELQLRRSAAVELRHHDRRAIPVRRVDPRAGGVGLAAAAHGAAERRVAAHGHLLAVDSGGGPDGAVHGADGRQVRQPPRRQHLPALPRPHHPLRPGPRGQHCRQRHVCHGHGPP
mmetsp:Transcript_61048/g.163962  ORF Transcript_61048/g.163962 Transcript_61048/m.163962 type:complete len:273 (+) Transcript_61048:6500-7318(+)